MNTQDETWSVFEFHKSVGWRRATQGIWFFDKEYTEGQLKVLRRVYPFRTFSIRSSKDNDGH